MITTTAPTLLIQAAAASPSSSPPTSGITTTFDIAAVISAVLWPLVLLIVLLIYRKKIPSFVRGIANRITGFEIAGVSLELAKATAFVPNWSASSTALDLRQKASVVQVTDSTAATFTAQLIEGGEADYAEANLGSGLDWLTSRLLIMSVLFARMKGIKCFVFLENSESVRRRFVGWAEPEKIRWALAKRYPELEKKYASAYADTLAGGMAVVVTNQGTLGQKAIPHDSGTILDLIRNFLGKLQVAYPPPAGPPNLNEWVLVDAKTNVYEQASWITSTELEDMLGADFHSDGVRLSDLRWRAPNERQRILLSIPDRFVAVVRDDQRFEFLVDRNLILEQAAKNENE